VGAVAVPVVNIVAKITLYIWFASPIEDLRNEGTLDLGATVRHLQSLGNLENM